MNVKNWFPGKSISGKRPKLWRVKGKQRNHRLCPPEMCVCLCTRNTCATPVSPFKVSLREGSVNVWTVARKNFEVIVALLPSWTVTITLTRPLLTWSGSRDVIKSGFHSVGMHFPRAPAPNAPDNARILTGLKKNPFRWLNLSLTLRRPRLILKPRNVFI